MERASEAPFQRFGLKQRIRNLQTVIKNCRKNSSLQPWTDCCVKMKKSSRYESYQVFHWPKHTFTLPVGSMSYCQDPSISNSYGIHCPLPAGQFRWTVVFWCCLGQLGPGHSDAEPKEHRFSLLRTSLMWKFWMLSGISDTMRHVHWQLNGVLGIIPWSVRMKFP